MTSTNNPEMDELMPPRPSLIRPPNALSTRTPSNLHRSSSISYNEDNDGKGPDDELLPEPEWMRGNEENQLMDPMSKSYASTTPPSMSFEKKKNRIKDRPWSKKKSTEEEEMEAFCKEEQIDVVGVPGNRPIPSHTIDDEDDLSYDDDVPSRWRQNISSPEERRQANVHAVALASERSAQRRLIRDVEQEARALLNDENDVNYQLTTIHSGHRRILGKSNSGNQNHYEKITSPPKHSGTNNTLKSTLSSLVKKQRNHDISKIPTPTRDDLDHHEQVRMEALKMLRLADQSNSAATSATAKGDSGEGDRLHKTETGGYSTQSSQVETLPRRTCAALRGLGLEQASPDGKSRFSTRTALYGPADVNGNFRISDDDDERNVHANNSSGIESKNNLDDVILIEEEGDDSPTGKKKSRSWGSRYSVDRHMMALHGGLSSNEVLTQMDQDHNQLLPVSAQGMYKSRSHDDHSGNTSKRWAIGNHVQSGSADCMKERGRSGRLWRTWMSSFQTTLNELSTRFQAEGESETLTKTGRHRNANNSGSSISDRDKGVLTGAFSRLPTWNKRNPSNPTYSSPNNGAEDNLCSLPSSITASLRNFNLRGQDLPPNMNFSARDDFEFERKRKRKQCFWLVSLLIFAILIFIGLIYGASSATKSIRNNKGSNHEPTITSSKKKVEFYIVSDTPHNPADVTKLRRDLSNLDPDKGSFLFHLGDVISGDDTLCTRSSYRNAASVLKESPIPVVLLPGNEDWNDCPNPRDAFENWMMHLNRFEENFDKSDITSAGENENTPLPSSAMVERHLARDENFAILLDDVLIIGVHLVNGKVPSQRQWDLREQDNVQWVEEQLSRQRSFSENSNKSSYRAVVLLGHAPATSTVGDFFWPVQEDLVLADVPVLYLHANYDGKSGVVKYVPFEKHLPKMVAAQMPVGSVNGITRVQVGFGSNPFFV